MNDSDRSPTAKPGDDSQPPPHQSVLRRLEARTRGKLGVKLDADANSIDDSSHANAGGNADIEAAEKLRDPSGRYQMLGELGRGGMGVVYRGRDQDLGREVAMKVLRDEYASRADVLARFVEEAQIGGQLQHPGIVPVYELGLQSGERPYFAMKLVKGETLAAQLAKRTDPAHERRRFLGIFEQVCQTIAYAHARHVVHRDLKPANVMIGAFGEVQVVDWGFAKVLTKQASEPATTQTEARSVIETVRSKGDSSTHSVAGSLFGTPAYMPPEQAQGDVERVDERADVFALGAILCEVLTGAPPYLPADGNLVRQAAQAELGGARERLKHCQADEVLIALATECLAPAASARPASAGEVAERVTAYLTSVEDRAREAQVRAAEARVKNRATLFGAAAVVLVLAVGTGVWLQLQHAADVRRDAAAQRVAAATNATSGARGQAQAAGFDAPLWNAAVASAEQLSSLAKGDDVDAQIRAGAEALRASVTSEANAALTEAARRERDRAMLAQLELARIPADEDLRVNATKELRRLDAAYASAFAAYLGGASLQGTPRDDTLASLRRGDIEVELAGSLDDWALARDALRDKDDAPDAAATARLREIALALDDGDAWRTQLRALLPDAAHEQAGLRKLAEGADFNAQTAVGCRVLAQALWNANERLVALSVLRRGLELHPSDFDLAFQLALDLEWFDDLREEAVNAYRVASAIRPQHAEVLHRHILALALLGKHADEERLARMFLARNPDDTHALFHVAMSVGAQSRFADAAELYQQVLERRPDYEVAHHHLGTALWQLGMRDEALRSYRRAIELSPNFALAHASLGVALSQLGELDEASASFRRAIECDPNLGVAYTGLGDVLRTRGKLDEAIASLRRGVECGPPRAQAHASLAYALARQGKLDEGIASFRRAVELEPRSGPTLYNFGLTLQAAGQREEAVRVYRSAASVFGDMQGAFGAEWKVKSEQRAAELESKSENELLALAEGKRLPDKPADLAAAGYTAYQRGDFALAARTYTRALETFPELRAVYPNALNAACMSALVGCGKGPGVELYSTAERASWRAESRRWLAECVALWRADFAGSPEQRGRAQEHAAAALADGDFAAVRDDAALSALPAAEAEAWRALWRELAEIATRAK